MTRSLNRAALTAVIGLAAAAFSGAALPDSSAGSPDGQAASSGDAPSAMQRLQSKRQEMQQLSQKLRRIQKNAMEANPGLKAEQKQFRGLVMEAMTSDSYDPSSQIEQIRALQSELQGGGDLAEDQRQTKSQELQQKTKRFRQKQQQAMQNEDVRAARRELDGKMKAAMQEQNPESGDIIARLNELQKEYQALLQEAIQQQQGGGQG